MDSSYVPIEAAVTTDLRGAPYNFALWDIYTGAQLVVFKGDKAPVPAKCLDIVDDTHIVTAHDNVLYIWSIANKNRREQKLFLTQRPSVVTMSPCSNYLFVGINESMQVWQINTGNMMCNLSRHYQAVSVIKVTPDNALVIVGGEDGLVIVWSLADVICRAGPSASLGSSAKETSQEPRYTWHHHQDQVTDIHVSCEGRNGLCVTVSADSGINIYNIATGRRIANLAMPEPIWSVVMDLNENRIFLGSQSGDIFQILLSSLVLSSSSSSSSSQPKQSRFVGHTGKIISLAISMDGSRLLSGSLDGMCRIWDVVNHKLISEIKHQGPLSNLKLITIPKSLALRALTGQGPALITGQLKRTLCPVPKETQIYTEDLFNDEHVFKCRNTEALPSSLDICSNIGLIVPSFESKDTQVTSPKLHPDSMPKSQDTRAIKQTLTELYTFAAEKIFKDASEDLLARFKPIASPVKPAIAAESKTPDKIKNGTNKPVQSNGSSNSNKSRKRQYSET